ncbi:Divalent metal cation (Fe/Co/Zn/Cd) transporter [Geosmithia morbida]|uniref:Divalent metal cation (Fe/Co/Zn/Cd) transporter n=1 Tax=Geosmithia morbida TaxID=1094350 RepID=A0A9P4YSN5_9HYPO|nr:Divalent metal cation (Fe/Co/Zn/Cd) transporter [Geosmithia morbida]KAF4121797.1 Divalent metal cation (Fe/Co/Zn/Cd) transporter [Geosmithia morbida]
MTPDSSNTITHHPNVYNLQHMDRGGRDSSTHSPMAFTSHSTSVEHHHVGNLHVGEHQQQQDAGIPIARHHSNPEATDVESQVTAGRQSRFPHVSLENDPYGLSLAYKTESDIAQLKANTSRKRDALPSLLSSSSHRQQGQQGQQGQQQQTSGKKGEAGPMVSRRQIQGFYENQNAMIERMLKTVEEHRADAAQEAGDDQMKVRIAVWGSLAANVFLTALQLYAAISSGSLSLFTTMADAIFDPLSNVTLILSNRAIARVDPRRFPAGKARLETVGNIVFCFLMTAVSLIIIAFAAQELAESDEAKDFHLPSVIAVCVAFGTKLALFLYCWAIKDRYSHVNILWQDHRNDLFINGFGVLTSVGGAKLVWWIDPMGAILLSVLISAIWLRTAFGEFLLLVGVAAPVENQQLITYVCLTHSDAILGIDTVRVYHSGPRLIAEVDIVMDPEGSLIEAHDVAEALQFKLESLPDIERAYVHIDYETTHKPEHAFKKDM